MASKYIDLGENRYVNLKNIELIHKTQSNDKKEECFIIQTTGGFRFTCKEKDPCYNDIIQQLQNSNDQKSPSRYYDHYDNQVYSIK